MYVDLEKLYNTQLYISDAKLRKVNAWYEKLVNKDFVDSPLPVYDFFGDGRLFLTDGHTRAYAAYISGIRKVHVYIDDDPKLVTNSFSQYLYRQSIAGCKRYGRLHIQDLDGSVLSDDEYAVYWNYRNDRIHNLREKTFRDETFSDYVDKLEISLKKRGYYLYGSKTLKNNKDILIVEDVDGNNYIYDETHDDLLTLVFPTMEHEDMYFAQNREMIAEFNADTKSISTYTPFMEGRYGDYVRMTYNNKMGIDLKGDFVPQSAFWLVRLGDKKILGTIRIRHYLNDFLKFFGGHIGYAIRPDERLQGYAGKMLALGIYEARLLGIQKALLTCDNDNIGSKKTIMNNGGVLIGQDVFKDKPFDRYEVEL